MNEADKHQPSGFTYDPRRGGIFCDAYKLAPYPGTCWRRAAILDCVNSIQELRRPFKTPKHFMEIGFGSGVFSYEFFLMGFDCSGYDQSKQAVDVANQIFNNEKRIIDFRNQLEESDFEKYDCLGAFEVLEHIEDDAGTLKEWGRLLKPDGIFIISVPARMKFWSYVDRHGGHLRRYEKKELISLLDAQGFDVLSCVNFGFPFKNLTRFFRDVLVHKPVYKRMQNKSNHELTQVSGIERDQEYKLKKFLPFRLIQMLCSVHRLFYRFDWSEGYVAAARKRNC